MKTIRSASGKTYVLNLQGCGQAVGIYPDKPRHELSHTDLITEIPVGDGWDEYNTDLAIHTVNAIEAQNARTANSTPANVDLASLGAVLGRIENVVSRLERPAA